MALSLFEQIKTGLPQVTRSLSGFSFSNLFGQSKPQTILQGLSVKTVDVPSSPSQGIMASLFKRIGEFPTRFVERAKQDIFERPLGLVKTAVTGTAKVAGEAVGAIVKPFTMPLVLILAVGIVVLILWGRLQRV